MSNQSAEMTITEIFSALCEVPFQSSSRDQALKRITELGKVALDSHTCSIVFIDLEKLVLTQVASTSSNEEMERLLKDQVVQIGSRQAGDHIDLEVLATGQPGAIYNLETDGQGVTNPKKARKYGYTSLLTYPLTVDNRLVGYINSFSARPGTFSEDEKRLIQILARHAILTLERFDHLQTLNKTLEIVSDISEQLLSIPPEDFLQLIAEKACELLSVPVCIIWRLDTADRKLRVAAASGNVDKEYRRLELRADETGVQERLQASITNIPDIRQRHDIAYAGHLIRRRWVSLLCASLRVGDQTFGLLDVFSKKRRQFTIWEKESFETFAHHAALSFQKVDLHKEAEGRKKLQKLTDVMLEMTEAKTVDTLLEIFLTGGLELVEAENGLIRRLDYNIGETRVVAHSKNLPKQYNLKLGTGITGMALKEERPLRVGNVRDPKWVNVHVQAWADTKSELAIPIILNNAAILVGRDAKSASKPIGVLNIESPREDEFTAVDEDCLWSLSRYAALMIERLDFNKKLDDLEIIEKKIAVAANYDNVIQILIRGITENLGYEYVNISRVVQELDCIRTEHVAGISQDKVERFKSVANHGLESSDIQADVVRTRNIEVPAAGDPRLDEKVVKEFQLDLLSRVYLPIIEPSRNQVIGTLEAGHKKEYRPYIYESDVQILKRLVDYAAQALQRRRSGILDNLSHELRAPIVGIRSNASFLQQRLGQLDKEMIEVKFNDVLADCQILLHQVAELEYVLGLRSRTESEVEKTLVYRDIIIKTINQLKRVVAAKGLDPMRMEYRIKDVGKILVWTDRAKLNQVVNNLLINSIKYAEKDPKQFTVRIDLDEKSKDFFIVKFKDWGIGIKKEYEGKVFNEGFRTPEARAMDVTGSGLGLTISKLIMDQLGGDLKLVNNYKPTEFHLLIPKSQRS